jgi:glycine betaine/proline transport system ATP-binding protein
MSGEKLREVRRTRVSMVFQHFALLPHRTVGENAAYGLQVQGINATDRRDRADKALEMVGLKGWGGSMPGELSGGMQQRVGLARALASGTDVMLMDEAFSALDPLIRREMQDQLIDLQERLDKTILFITHDLNEAMRLGDRIAMMRDGRIEQIGNAEQILNEPASDYVAKFVQDVDRSRVLSARSVMERPPATLAAHDEPKKALALMEEHEVSSLVVVDDADRLQGFVYEAEVRAALQADRNDLPVDGSETAGVAAGAPLNDLFAPAARRRAPLVVCDEEHRFLGLIPQSSLLAAVGSSTSEAEESHREQTVESGEQAGSSHQDTDADADADADADGHPTADATTGTRR